MRRVLSVCLLLAICIPLLSGCVTNDLQADDDALDTIMNGLVPSSFTDDQFVSGNGIQFQTLMQVYPVGADISCRIVNNHSTDLHLSYETYFEIEIGGVWYNIPSEFKSEESGEDTGFTVYGNNEGYFAVTQHILSYKDRESHYRVVKRLYGDEGAYKCEFWIAADWEDLPLEEVLQKTPFEDLDSGERMADIVVNPEYSVTESGDWAFDYTIMNLSETTIEFGLEYYVEILLNGYWYVTPMDGWDQPLYGLEPGGSIILRAYLINDTKQSAADFGSGYIIFTGMQFIWPAGEYRLVKPISAAPLTVSSSRYYTAQFTVQ